MARIDREQRVGNAEHCWASQAVAPGASVLMPVQKMFWGAPYGKIVDPFGHEWGINQQLEEQTEDQTNAAADEFFAKQQRSSG